MKNQRQRVAKKPKNVHHWPIIPQKKSSRKVPELLSSAAETTEDAEDFEELPTSNPKNKPTKSSSGIKTAVSWKLLCVFSIILIFLTALTVLVYKAGQQANALPLSIS